MYSRGILRGLLSVIRKSSFRGIQNQPTICRCVPIIPHQNSHRTFLIPSTILNEREKWKKVAVEAKLVLDDYSSNNVVNSIKLLQVEGHPNVPGIFDAVILGLLERDALHDAVDLIELIIREDLLKVKNGTYNDILNAFITRRIADPQTDVTKAFADFVHFMHDYGYTLDGYGYFHVMHMAALAGSAELAEDCFYTLKDMFEINRRCYSMVLLAHCNKARRTNNYDDFVDMVEHFSDELLGRDGTQAQVHLFVKDLIEEGRLKEAVEIVKALEEKCSIKSSQITFATVLKGFVEHRRRNDELETVREYVDFLGFMTKRGFKTEGKVLEHMLEMAVLQGGIHLAQECFDVEHMFRMAVQAGESGLAQDCFNVISKYPANRKNFLSLNEELLDAYLKAEERYGPRGSGRKNFNNPFRVMKRVLHNRPTDIATDFPIPKLRRLLEFSSAGGSSSLAQTFYDALQRTNHELDGESHELLLRAHINEARRTGKYEDQAGLIRCFNNIIEKGHPPSDAYNKNFLENLVLGNSIEEARAAIQKLEMGEADEYLAYLDALIRIHDCLQRKDREGARSVEGIGKQERERFISLCSNPSRLSTRAAGTKAQ